MEVFLLLYVLIIAEIQRFVKLRFRYLPNRPCLSPLGTLIVYTKIIRKSSTLQTFNTRAGYLIYILLTKIGLAPNFNFPRRNPNPLKASGVYAADRFVADEVIYDDYDNTVTFAGTDEFGDIPDDVDESFYNPYLGCDEYETTDFFNDY